MGKQKIIIAYVPVLHEGYRKFFQNHADASTVYILGQEIIEEFDHLYKEIRALKPELVRDSLKAWEELKMGIEILTKEKIAELNSGNDFKIISPKEDVVEDVLNKYFSEKEKEFDSIFLRWDKHNSVKPEPIHSDGTISADEAHGKFIKQAYEESKKSVDIWRRIGSVVVKDGEIILSAHNEAFPEHQGCAFGDPRGGFHKGENLELSLFVHSEAKLIAEAAQKGISLEGAEIFVTTFPCPPCAKLIAYSGIKKLYYREGYGVLDAEQILKSKGVEIIFVDVKIEEENDSSLVSYEKLKK